MRNREGSRGRRISSLAVVLVLAALMVCAAFVARAGDTDVRAFDKLMAFMQANYWDTNYRGLDWPKETAAVREKVKAADTTEKAMGEIGDLLAKLKDSHTRLEPPGSDDTGTTDVYGGIGCVLQLRSAEGYCVVGDVFTGNPAYEAGLKTGDKIWAVDGKPVSQFVAEKHHPVEAIRGEIGTKVVLSVENATGAKHDVTIERRQIVHEKQVTSKRLGSGGEIGYITFDNFYDQVSRQVAASLKGMADTKGLILDLRGNPGGLVRELVDVAAYLGVRDLGRAVSRTGSTAYRTLWVTPLYTKPLAIIVDGGTASSAEILSTCAKESGRATLVGQPTANGTALMVSYPMGNGWSAGVTTAQFFTPKGHAYDAPTPPNVELAPVSADDIAAGNDTWLDKAVDVLEQQITSAARRSKLAGAA